MSENNPDSTATRSLILRAKGGEREAFEALFATAAPRVAAYVEVRLGLELRSRLEVGDVLQETWLAAVAGLREFEPAGPGAFLRWLCRIAEHRIRDLAEHFDAQKRRGEVQCGSAIDVAFRESMTGITTAAIRDETRGRLVLALAELDADLRAVVLARFFRGLTLEEIAAESGRSLATIHRQLGRAVVRLGTRLRDLAEDVS